MGIPRRAAHWTPLPCFESTPRHAGHLFRVAVDRHVLDEFGGMDVSGEWTLVATDHGARNMGRFLDWHIEFELDAPISNGYDDTE